MKSSGRVSLRMRSFSAFLGIQRCLALQCRAPAQEKRITEAGHLLRLQHLGVMPAPRTGGAGKLRVGPPAADALRTTHNKAVDTDAQVRPLPSVAPILGRRSLLRYASPNDRR